MNKYSIKIGEWIIKTVDNTHPKELMIEVTTRCNYDCIYCFRRRLINEELGDMNEKLFYKIIDEAASIGVEKISFSGWGEPLIHPKIIEFLKYAKKKDLEILLNTNGFFLPKYVEALYDIGVDNITVSVDADDDNVYKLIRRGGDLVRIINGLLRIKELKIRDNALKPEVHIQFTINRYNYRNLLPVTRLAYKLGVSKVIVSNIIPLNKEYEEQLSCYRYSDCIKEANKLITELTRISLEYGVEVSLPNYSLSYSERSCPFIKRYATFIRYDGGVAPCIYYAHHWRNYINGVEREIKPVIFGYLTKQKLIDIWRSPEYTKFRALVYFMHQPSCLDCPVQEYCTLTLANDYDCWGNTPTCAHCPYSRDMVRCPL